MLPPAENSASSSPGNDSRVTSVVLPVGGVKETIKGVPVIIVDEQVANEYNDQLEKRQKESQPSTRPRSTNGSGATPDSTSTPSSNSRNVTVTVSGGSPTPSGSSQAGTPSEGVGLPSGQATDDTSSSNSTSQAPASKQESSAETKQGGLSLVMKVMLGCLGSASFAAVLFLFFIRRRGKRGVDKESSSYQEMTDNSVGNSGIGNESIAGQVLAWWSDDDMLSHRLNTANISDVRVIGSSGGFCVMWLVNYRGGSRKLVAKRLIQGNGPTYDAAVIQLVAEAKIASSLQYSSIVPFAGVAWTDKINFQVLYEYMSNGSLNAYLAQTNASSLAWLPDKLQLAIDVIEALVYTHSFNPPLLHRDLKSSNVLLDDNLREKLTGFGSARPESDSDTMTTTEVGTGRWLAPEILSGSTSYGTPNDIYSFGVVLCELDTHQAPYAMEATDAASESALLLCVARGELRPSVSASCPLEIRDIAEACLAFDAEQRPIAMQVAHMLRSLRTASQ